MEGLQGNHSVLGLNDSNGIILSWDRTTPGESFCPGIERLQGVLLTEDGRTPGESFCSGMERLQGSLSVQGVILSWSHSVLESYCPGVILSWIHHRTRWTPGKSFSPWMERLLRKSFCLWMEQLRRSHSVLVKRILGSPSVLA